MNPAGRWIVSLPEFQDQLIVIQIRLDPAGKVNIGNAWHLEVGGLPFGVLALRAGADLLTQSYAAEPRRRGKRLAIVVTHWLKNIFSNFLHGVDLLRVRCVIYALAHGRLRLNAFRQAEI